jgi:hypothetical protein
MVDRRDGLVKRGRACAGGRRVEPCGAHGAQFRGAALSAAHFAGAKSAASGAAEHRDRTPFVVSSAVARILLWSLQRGRSALAGTKAAPDS